MKRILVVDNNPVILKLISCFLEREGYTAQTALSSLEALQILKKEEKPDVIFTDMVMPQISGGQLCHILRSMPELQSVPIIIISAIAKEAKLDPSEFGAISCIAKGPKLTEHILAILKKLENNSDPSLVRKHIGYGEVFQREISKELLSVKKHYDIILNNLDVGVLELTPTGEIVFANPFAISIFGLSEEKLLSLWFPGIFPETQTELIKYTLNLLEESIQLLEESSKITVNGRSLSMSFIPVHDPPNDSVLVIILDITKRIQSDFDLRKSEESFRLTFENSADAIVWFNFDTGMIINCNRAAEILFKRSKNELTGQHRSILHSEDKAEDFAGLFDEKSEADRIEEFETEIKNRVGETVPVRISAAISFVGDTTIVQGIFSNVSDKMQSQEKLSTTNEYLQSLLDSVQAGIVVIDLESRMIVDINPVVNEMLGLPREQIIGQECNTLICSVNKADCLHTEEGMCNERSEQVITDSRGREIPVLRTSVVKEISGQKFIIVSFIDISERKKLEERLHQLSITDGLTNILNRRGFITLSEQQLKVADRRKKPFYLLYADVNNMKLINDTHGHSSGDEALVQVAKALKMFRESDIVGRLGGDEFAALFSGESGELTKELITKRFNENLQIVSKQRDRKFKLTISVGIIRYDPLNPCSLPDLLSRADQLMYKHKLKRT